MSSENKFKMPNSLNEHWMPFTSNKDFKEKAVKDAAAASDGKYGYIDIAATPINPDLYAMIDADILNAAFTLPFFRLGSQLRIAVVDPANAQTKVVLDKG